MKKIISSPYVFLAIYSCILFVIFNAWFQFSPLTGGDWEYYFSEAVSSFPLIPSSWNSSFGSGFGGNQTFFMVPNSFFMTSSTILNRLFGFDWIVIERIMWFYPYLIIASYSAYFFFRTVFSSKFASLGLLASFFYVCNTYSLMIVGGGQMGVALGYAFIPLVIGLFIRLTKQASDGRIYYILLFSVVSSMQLVFDVRVFYMTWIVVFLYFIFFVAIHWEIKRVGVSLKQICYFFLVPFFIVVLLHSWWIFPFFISSQNPLSSLSANYLGVDSLSFFSFASFSHALSLLQSNWPENIFGKTSFLKPEFLLLPILAFSSLFFLHTKKIVTLFEKKMLLFLILIGLLGVFLAKGTNEPFGVVYTYLFIIVPGFFMFRDPSKWYMLISFAYSFLVPLTLFFVYSVFKHKKLRTIFLSGFILLFCLYFFYLLKPAFTGQLTGTFKQKEIPLEYVMLKDILSRDKSFSRVLWLPSRNRFGFVSENHPSINGTDVFKTNNDREIIEAFGDPDFFSKFASGSVSYIVVPTDPVGEQFITDRTYDNSKREKLIKSLDLLGYPLEKSLVGNIVVYRIKNSLPLFHTIEGEPIAYVKVSPTDYYLKDVSIPDSIVFTNGYDPDWVFSSENIEIRPIRFRETFNLYEIPEHVVSGQLLYKPQAVVSKGLIVSGITGVVLIILVLRYRRF